MQLPEAPLDWPMDGYLDPEWYRERYPDIVGSGLDPRQHFILYGAAEKRDPNRFFDSAWYIKHNPDVASSGFNPLLHYAQSGAAEMRNPHPRFDAVYYVEQHPEAVANPLLYHLQTGVARGYLTEKSVDIRDYLPSERPALPLPHGVFADVVVVADHGLDETGRCIRLLLMDRNFPMGRIIVVDDRPFDVKLGTWLEELAAEGYIHLIRNRRPLGFNPSVNLGVEAAEGHDVVLLTGGTEVPAGWLRRLMAHAYAAPNIATVSPFWDRASLLGYRNVEGSDISFQETSLRIDEVCQIVNIGRSVVVPVMAAHCVYIRRAALLAVGGFGKSDFCHRTTAAGWDHRAACDTFVHWSVPVPPRQAPSAKVIPFQFAVTAALFRASKLPVILMVTHNLGGGVRRHIDSLVERYRTTARMLLLEGTNRGEALSIASLPDRPVLTRPTERHDDLITVLQSANVSRIHVHHLLRMDLDIRALIHRLDVPFDLTVHDYYAICPQINLLRWEEGLYCGEPGPAGCNACIADQSSHGARDIVSWRRDWAWQFMDADRVLCPSGDVKARLDRHGLGERAIVVPHEQQANDVWPTRLPAFSGAPMRIVLLGVLANHKGARAVAEVAEAVTRATTEIHLIGHLEASFPQPARRLIKATGKYKEGDVPALLQRIDPHVFWFPSSAPETYSYTLSTAIASGLPIVATNLGAFIERLAGRPLTWLVDHRASAKDWLAAFDEVRGTLRDGVAPPVVARPVACTDFYTDWYLSPGATAIEADAGPSRLFPHKTSGGSRTGQARCAPVVKKFAGRVDLELAKKSRIGIVPERYESAGLTPCGYIRLLQPLDHPAIGDGCDMILANAETIFDCDVDLIVTQRYAIPDVATANRLAEHARRTGAKLLYDLDDDLLNVPVTHPDAAMLQPLAEVVQRMLTLADAVWVSTHGLAERLKSIRGDAVVIENRLDERIWVHDPVRGSVWDDPVRILCMGTSTHDHDFAMIEPVLLRLKAEYGERVVIDVLGMTSRGELPAGLNRIGPSMQGARSYPGFVHWLTSAQPRWHVGLAPLLDTPFNRSKSPIKAMDYAALGLTVLASDTPVYRGSIADGSAGQLVANNQGAWHAALDWQIRNQDLRAGSAARAREAFLSRATLAGHAAVRLAALKHLLPGRSDDPLLDALAALTIAHGATDPVTRKRRLGRGGR